MYPTRFSKAPKIYEIRCDIVIIMITIQELHRYQRMVDLDILPPIVCRVNELDGTMVPWLDEKEEPCFWCMACDSKYYPGLNQVQLIRSLLGQ